MSALIASAQMLNAMIWFALAVVMAAVCAQVAPTPGLRKWCWTLPLFKVVADLLGGVPSNAYLLGPFVAERWDFGRFQLGVGFERPFLVPTLHGRLGASMHGEWFSLAVGDMPVNALAARGFGWVIPTLLSIALAVGVVRLVWRARAWLEFARAERMRRSAPVVERHRVHGREVRVIEHGDSTRGSYTSGVLSPVIWLSPAVSTTAEEERRAVIEHELAHVRQLDVLLFAVVRLLRDVFWFVPGLGFCAGRVQRQAELAADRAAIRNGCSPSALARAIAVECEQKLAHAGAQLGGDGPEAERVTALSLPHPRRRVRLGLRVVVLGYLCLSLFGSDLFRHH